VSLCNHYGLYPWQILTSFSFVLFALKGADWNGFQWKKNQLKGQIPSEIGAASNLEIINFCKLHMKRFSLTFGNICLPMFADVFHFFLICRL